MEEKEKEIKEKIDEKVPDSKENIKKIGINSSYIDKETEPGEIIVNIIDKNFDYLMPSEDESISFSDNKGNIVVENNIYEDEGIGIIKYAICILLKDNSTINCFLLEKTIKGIINNFGDLSTLQIKPEDIYIFVFANQIIKKDGNLVTKESLNKITKEKKYLKIPLKPKDENRKIKIDLICKKYRMSEIESLQIYYNYILNKLKKENRIIASSILTAGVVPNNDCLKKLIELCFPTVRNPNKIPKNYGIAVPSLEVNINDNVNSNNNLFLKIAQYERIHFNIYNMSFYYQTATIPISSLLSTMLIDNSLMYKLKLYYKKIDENATIDYHDYNLALKLYQDQFKIYYYCDENLGTISYYNFNYMEYKDNWVNKFSGYYGNFMEILRTFINCNRFLQKIFMFFQIIGLLIEFIYPSLSILVIYSIFYEAFRIYDISPAVFMTLLYLIMYLGSGVCSLITVKSEKIESVNFFFLIFMEIYYLFIIICSIIATDNINKNKEYNKLDRNSELFFLVNGKYKFNKAACACLIIFTFILAILPILIKMNNISKNIVQMLIYLVLGAPSSTSNFLIAKIWRAPETVGGVYPEDLKGITILIFFLFNLFFGFLNFFNYNREKRAKCVIGLSIFYLIYLFFKIVAIIFPLLCGTKINTNIENKIAKALNEEINSINESNNNPLAKSSDKLSSKNDEEKDEDNEKEDDYDGNGDKNEEENQSKKNESNEEEKEEDSEKDDEFSNK